jgi:hypothetical protein
MFLYNFSEQKDAVESAIDNWRGNKEVIDDIAMIGIKV